MNIIMKDWAICPTEKNGIYEIYSPKDLIMGSGDIARIDLGFKIELPIGTIAILVGRSGLANKGIDPIEFYMNEGNSYINLGGIINTLHNDWGIVLKNFGGLMINIKKRDKIASFIVLQNISEKLIKNY